MMENKKGLSPVIATTLLILMAVIIAVIIFLWVKSFLGEKIVKDLGGGEEIIQNFCEKVGFTGDVSVSNGVTIQNTGEVPIYGIEVKKKGLGSVKSLGVAYSGNKGTKVGDTESLTRSVSGFANGDDMVLIPILLGTTTNGVEKTYPCDSKFGIEVQATV